MQLSEIIKPLFDKGLGELLVLHRTNTTAVLGLLTYEKGRMIIRDQKYLSDVKPTLLDPCWDNGIIGVVCASKGKEWESLTYYGLEQCGVELNLERTRHRVLAAAENQYGDKLTDFVGSIYRGYQLLLDNHFLPVVLLKQLGTKNGEYGLAISDLRAAPLPLSLIRIVNDEVRQSVEKQLVLSVEDVELNSDQFDKLFESYLDGNKT